MNGLLGCKKRLRGFGKGLWQNGQKSSPKPAIVFSHPKRRRRQRRHHPSKQEQKQMSAAMEAVLQLEEVPAGIVAQRHVHHRTQHRVRLVGEGAQATALKTAAPWLSWMLATACVVPDVPRGYAIK